MLVRTKSVTLTFWTGYWKKKGSNLKNRCLNTSLAKLPYIWRPLSSLFSPSIDPKIIRELATCTFIERAENVGFLGPPGTGKTHLSVALGLKAIQRRYRTLFTTAAGPIAALNKAYAENRLDEKLKYYCVPRVLVIDEIGYVPVDVYGATYYFN